MEIKIDTKHDSLEDIKKVIRLLQELADKTGDSGSQNLSLKSSSAGLKDNIGLDSNSKPKSKPKAPKDGSEEKENDNPEIMVY